MTNTAKEFPDFFKVFLIEKHSDRMLIPVAFVKLMHSKKKVIKDFILRDDRGRDWHVKVRRIGDKLYFEDGWKRFREENSLEENDFLFFTHIENNVFKFKILELSSMCEKVKVIDEEENINMMENHENDDGGDGNDDDDIMVEEDEEDDDDDVADDDVEDDDEYIIKEEEEENEEVYKKCNKSEPQHCRTCKNWDNGSSSAGSILEDDEINAEMYVQPGNPYFIAKPLHYRPNELHIPKNIIKDFCICFTKYINLVCCNCKDMQSNDIAYYHNMLPQMNTNHIEKRGKVRTWTNGRILVLGWLDLCKMSKIRENDTCLCEIVLRDNEAIEMIRVHVVRKE
ncbi:B3 domain-containing protein REM20 [Trifolium repens]|nr:B3 domain-containing protein REM20 [Trifolium repens]